jgi:tetratricopeptide (TPR) repeat protein
LEAGRNHLLRQRPAQAVNAFRQASRDPALAGEAFNGMGVAYAKMGRPDLARRYFDLAVAADPHDARYQRNLARLEGAGVLRALASRPVRDSRSSASATSSEPARVVGAAEAATAAGRAGGTQAVLVRTSRYETRLTSRRQSGGLADARFQREFHVSSPRSGRGVHVAGNPMAIARLGQRAAPPLAQRERWGRSERLR